MAFWAFISFYFGLLGLHFFSFCPLWPSLLHFWLVWAAAWGPPHKLQKTARFLIQFKQILSAPKPAEFCNFWPFGLSFPFILAFWGFISFHFGLLGFHFLSFWPFEFSFPFILAFWAVISFYFGLGLSFPFILAFWAFISFHFGLLGLHFFSFWLFRPSFPYFWFIWAATWGPPHKLPKTARFLIKFKQILSAPRLAAFCNFWPFGLSFPFWPFRPSFPFILPSWAFISFHFSLLGFHFVSFWPFGPSFPFIFAFWAFISFHFGLLGLHFLSFWPFGLSFPFILAFWAFISFHFGLLGRHFLLFWPFAVLYFLSFWPFGPSFPFILAFWASISFHFGFLGLHFLIFGLSGLPRGAPPTSCQKRPVF